jgi:23S rRNA (cytidine1920-2'-O)/16S rRNA (cytidine1409-2'-O)-methyltransferase
LERTNVRDLRPEAIPFAPDLVTADLSVLSLRLALPALAACAAPRAEFVFLVKPQFEAGREDVRAGGVVTEPSVWGRVLRDVAAVFTARGIEPAGVMASPLLGPAGNVEFLLHASRRERMAEGTPDRGSDGEIPAGIESAFELAIQDGTRLAAGNE